MTEHPKVLVRMMDDGEQDVVRGLVRRSFPLLQRGFVSLSPDVLIAERDGEPVGAAVLRMVRLPGKRVGGTIAWLMVVPEARNLGIGQQLVDEALRRFDERRCDEVLCTVEGYNTSSSRRMLARGFSLLAPGRQARRFGFGLPVLWLRAFHFLDIGHFLWASPGDDAADNPLAQWWGVALVNSLFALLALWRANGFVNMNPMLLLTIPLGCIAVLGVRGLAMKLTAQVGRLGKGRIRVRFRAWESGFPVSFLLAAAIGRLLPIPGSFYPEEDDWRYRSLLHRLEPMAFAGSLSVLVLVLVVTGIPRFFPLDPSVRLWLDSAAFIGKPLALFDVALPFFPFAGFNGRRIWDWNKAVWVVMALGAVVIFLFA